MFVVSSYIISQDTFVFVFWEISWPLSILGFYASECTGFFLNKNKYSQLPNKYIFLFFYALEYLNKNKYSQLTIHSCVTLAIAYMYHRCSRVIRDFEREAKINQSMDLKKPFYSIHFMYKKFKKESAYRLNSRIWTF